ncbi:hypothetical protein [Tabrizicola sp.]|uniref:hypothetical protein n=1 Tax=Tabrizicola sp. TaxID=2005166 RepID=UPI003D2A15AE
MFRSVVSVLGLAFVGFLLWRRGVPDGPALIEVVGVALAFFGGTLALSVWRLVKRNHP